MLYKPLGVTIGELIMRLGHPSVAQQPGLPMNGKQLLLSW